MSNGIAPAGNANPSAWWKRALFLLLLCSITFAIYPLWTRLRLGDWTFPFDDPWTHQVYARNLAWHGQYAFNLGETSTGSSAPLWTALMVPAHWLRLPPVAWALALGLLSLGLLGAIVWEWASRRFPSPLPLLLAVATLLSPQIAWAGVEGMETALVAALALLILRRLDGGRWTSGWAAFLDGLLNGLLLWLRPEGPLLTLVAAWQRRREGWARLLAFVAGFLTLAGPYLAFHWALGGRPLPQTVYAKVAYYGRPVTWASLGGFLRGLGLSFAPGPWPLLVLLLPLALWRMARRREWRWAPGLAWAGITLLLAALRLPVVLHFGRHFAPTLPILLLAGGEALLALPRSGRQAVMGIAACLLVIGIAIAIPFYWMAGQGILDSHVAMGHWIAAHLPAGTRVATHDVGAIGFFGGHPIVDTMALITPELTPIVAARDPTRLLGYLQGHDVHYLAAFPEVYPEVLQQAGVRQLDRQGRLVLLYLP